jgi:hypothetical protein
MHPGGFALRLAVLHLAFDDGDLGFDQRLGNQEGIAHRHIRVVQRGTWHEAGRSPPVRRRRPWLLHLLTAQHCSVAARPARRPAWRAAWWHIWWRHACEGHLNSSLSGDCGTDSLPRQAMNVPQLVTDGTALAWGWPRQHHQAPLPGLFLDVKVSLRPMFAVFLTSPKADSLLLTSCKLQACGVLLWLKHHVPDIPAGALTCVVDQAVHSLLDREHPEQVKC